MNVLRHIFKMRLEPLEQKYLVEKCIRCDKKHVIYRDGITACPECGYAMFPCETIGCDNCTLQDCPIIRDADWWAENMKVTNPPVPMAVKLLFKFNILRSGNQHGRNSKKKTMVFKEKGEQIIFDDFTDNTEEYQSYWAEMCPECRNKHRAILGNRVSIGAQGTCSVQGCEKEADYYVDFDEKDVIITG